jgi:hypothetical protein
MGKMLVRRPSPSQHSSASPEQPATHSPVEVPQTNEDPVWSLCPWPVTVDMHGQVFDIEPLPAVHWLKHLMNKEGSMDLIGLLDDIAPGMDDFCFDHDINPQELMDLGLDIISTVAARPWWLALRLTTIAANNWQVFGPKLMMSGGDATVLSLAGWLDMLLWQIMDSIDPKKATMFTMQLQLPPPELQEEESDPFALTETDRSAFLAMA